MIFIDDPIPPNILEFPITCFVFRMLATLAAGRRGRPRHDKTFEHVSQSVLYQCAIAFSAVIGPLRLRNAWKQFMTLNRRLSRRCGHSRCQLTSLLCPL